MKDKTGDMVMCDTGSIDAEILRIMNYEPYLFDSGKRVIFLVDKKGLKLFNKFKKYVLKRGLNDA